MITKNEINTNGYCIFKERVGPLKRYYRRRLRYDVNGSR